MKNAIHLAASLSLAVFLLNPGAFAQVTLHGTVRTMTGVPIAGATVQLITADMATTTDDSGCYDFMGATGVRPAAAKISGHSFALQSRSQQLFLDLNQSSKVTADLFDLSGRLVSRLVNSTLPRGENRIALGGLDRQSQMYLLKLQVGAASSYARITALAGKVLSVSDAAGLALERATLAKSGAVFAADSIVVTHPDFDGGLDYINTRKVRADTGLQNFRMFAIEGWYASNMNFIFTPDKPGISYYKQMVSDYEATEQQVQRQIQQSIWRSPDEVPSNKKWATYNCNVNGNVTTGVASTGGNTLNFNPDYIDGKSWWEILGVQHHEMVHSYQPYYSTTGASGYGEAIPDAIRALCGFFYWPKGSKCSGGYDQAYQTGGKYWYFIELKHPGFIYEMYKRPNGDIATRVEDVTGETLSSLCAECESKGMPYTLGRGSF
jgi:hypothetical protein